MTPSSLPSGQTRGRPLSGVLERWLPSLAALTCLILTIRIWQVVGEYQPMWPLPAGYLIEVLTLTMAAALLRGLGSTVGPWLTWMAFGALGAFAVLGMFSVGAAYVPICVLLLASGALAGWRQPRRLPLYVACAITAALVQAGIVLAVARWVLAPG